MVFVWSRLFTNGDPYFTLSQVALNDAIMIFAFAPIVGLLLGFTNQCRATLLTSVVLYIVVPVILGPAWRKALLRKGQAVFDNALTKWASWSMAALLATLVLLFAFQGEALPATAAGHCPCWRCRNSDSGAALTRHWPMG